MQPVCTVVAFDEAPARAAARLDATALACEVLRDFAAIKRAHGGSLLAVLLDNGDDAALSAATKAIRILRRRGGGAGLVVLPAAQANPGPQARARLQRAAGLTSACVLQPVHASWADAVRCFVEPLSVFGLAGVDPREVHALLKSPRAAVLHPSAGAVLAESRDVLVSCRLRPDASLSELDAAARAAAERAPRARILVAGPEVGDAEGPAVLAASLL